MCALGFAYPFLSYVVTERGHGPTVVSLAAANAPAARLLPKKGRYTEHAATTYVTIRRPTSPPEGSDRGVFQDGRY